MMLHLYERLDPVYENEDPHVFEPQVAGDRQVRLLPMLTYEGSLVFPNKSTSTESDNILILWTSLGLPYLVQANLDSMATHLWAHRNISSRLSMTVAPNFSRAVNHYLRLDCVANDTSLLAILDGTVAILANLMTLETTV